MDLRGDDLLRRLLEEIVANSSATPVRIGLSEPFVRGETALEPLIAVTLYHPVKLMGHLVAHNGHVEVTTERKLLAGASKCVFRSLTSLSVSSNLEKRQINNWNVLSLCQKFAECDAQK